MRTMTPLTHERSALAKLRLRGAARPRKTGPGGGVCDDDISQAIGHLEAAVALRGDSETPGQQCRRLGLTGYIRRVLIPQNGGGRYRLNAAQTAAAYRRRGPPVAVSDAVLNQRRADALHITIGSPEWDALMARDRAFFARMKRMRMAAKPNHDDNGRPTKRPKGENEHAKK